MRQLKEFVQILVLLPFAILMAVLTYLDWYVFGDLPERKF